MALTEEQRSTEDASRPRRRGGVLVGLVIAAFFVLQVAMLLTLRDSNAELDDLRGDVAALGAAGLDPSQIPDLGAGQSSPAPTDADAAAGNLPRFLGGGADAALGRNVGQLAGLEYYSGQNAVYAPGDGVARAYMVWAHWCPYCQEELPLMTQWHEENGSSFENFELVTVTTAMDDTAANPLVPYLDSSQFPFPVLVDEDGSMARQLGVNAFPFWVFTAPDGTVVGRAAGAIDIENLDAVFRQLEEIEPVGDAAPADG